MGFELERDEIEETQEIGDYVGVCPKCHDTLTFWHESRCTECDQRRILWCPTCERHRKLKF